MKWMQPRAAELKREEGFTLIELSIVLVIIGLIVGGVLVGQDLIKAAELRAGVSQIEKYEAAANTFRTKYNGLPGDIMNPANYGLSNTGLTPNGNGVLNRSADDGTSFDLEAAAFFRHLAQTSLIADSITGTSFGSAAVGTLTNYVPVSKLGRGVLVLPVGASGINYYVLSVPTVAAGVLTFTDGTEMAVIDAFGFDNKLDDGNPSTGKVIAVTDITTPDAGVAGPPVAPAVACVDSTGNTSYQLSTNTLASSTRCSIRVRASF